MKILTALLLLCFAFQSTNAQHIEKIVAGQTTIKYLQSSHGGAPNITYPITVTINYNGTSTDSVPLLFTITNISNSALNPVITNPADTIPASNYTLSTTAKSISFTLNVKIDAVPSLTTSEFFDIRLNGSTSSDPAFRVIVENIPLGQPSATAKISHLRRSDSTSLFPLINDNASTQERRLALLKFKVTGTLAKDSVVDIVLTSNSGNSITPTLITQHYTIQSAQTQSGNYEASIPVYFNINSVKDFGKDEYFYLSFANDSVYDVISFTRKNLFNPNKPFWVEIGANLDLVDGLDANNFFTGVFFYRRDVRPIFYKKKNTAKKTIDTSRSNNFGVFAGVYESKTISSVDEIDFGTRNYYDRNSILLVRNDSLGVFQDTGKIKTTQVVKNISLFFSPQVRLTNRSANADGFHVSASLWMELQWQRLKSTIDYSSMRRLDTFYVPKNNITGFEDLRIQREYDIRSHYFGLGLPVFFKEENTNLFFNPVIGFSNQPKEDEITSLITSVKAPVLKRKWRPFYIMQFRLNEEKYGITFTGEVRGLIRKNSRPFVSLAMTKKFDLTKFMEFK